MTITIKTPITKLQDTKEVELIYNHIKKNPKYAYTREGIMIEVFAINPKAISKSFSKWEKPHKNLYLRITNNFIKLINQQKLTINNTKPPYKYYIAQTINTKPKTKNTKPKNKMAEHPKSPN